METLKKARLKDILERSREKKVLIIGDFCVDGYWEADMSLSTLSLETPRFPRPIVDERYTPGASGTVAWNASDIGLDVYGYFLMGDDWRGEILKKELRDRGIHADYAQSLKDRITPAYIKPILHSSESKQEDSRLDFDNYTLPSEDFIKSQLSTIKNLIEEVDAVLLQDQFECGILGVKYLRDQLNQIAENAGKPFMVDSRHRIDDFKNMILKPNRFEAIKGAGIDTQSEDEEIDQTMIQKAASQLYAQSKKPLYITAAEKGMYLYQPENNKDIIHIPTIDPSGSIDVTGAGDTVMSALIASLLGGASYAEAGLIANIASSVTVKKLNQTGTATPEEILSKYEDFDKNLEF